MVKYVSKRLLYAVFLVIGVSILIYMLTMLMPSDYIDSMTAAAVQQGAMKAEEVQRLKELYGLADKSFLGIMGGYFKWLTSVFRGDFGFSFVYGKPVTTVIGEHMWLSFAIALVSFIVETAIAIPLGIRAAVKQYGAFDYTVSVLAMMGVALPSFFLSALLINMLSIKLGWLPLTGLITATKILTGFSLFLDKLKHLILPLIVSIILGIGGLMRYTRTNMLEVLNSDYIRTARAKGVPEHSVIYKHTFRNTLIPLVTTLGGMLPGLFSGMIIIETVFALPGIGSYAYRATVAGDIPFVMGYNMFLSMLTILGYIISDVLYVAVDPRVKLS
ncbi:MAG: ABC transporter permease [Oscillospiraceae bacterium]|jgi:peptide/nickel transport system permease protein|nr:ABC transporter permease [Oscillospiraceae bacterium]